MSVPVDESVRGPTETESPVVTMWSRLQTVAPYSGRPASIRDVVEYTRAGGWVPGDHEWWVELPGYVYGYVVAIPVTVGLNTVAWVLQRFTRLLMVALVAGLLWWAGL